MPSEFSARRGDVSQTLSLSVGGIEIGGLTQHHLLSAHIFSSGHFYGLLLLLAPSRPSYLFIFLLFFSVFLAWKPRDGPLADLFHRLSLFLGDYTTTPTPKSLSFFLSRP